MNSLPTESPLLSLRQLSAMLAARVRLIATVLVVVILVTGAVTVLMPRQWTASSDVYVDYHENDSAVGGRNFSATQDDSYVQTQIDMIRSQVVADEVVQTLNLHSSEEYREWARNDGETRASDRLVQQLIKNTSVEKGRSGRVLSVSYDARSPEQAKQLVNAIVQAYITVSQRIASSAARSLFEQYNAQLQQLRTEADNIQEKLTHYRQETGIIGDAENTDREAQLLDQMTNTLRLMQTQKLEADARRSTAQHQVSTGTRLEELPEAAQLTSLNSMKSSLNDVERRLAEAQASLGANHPTLLGLQAERRELQRRIDRTAQAAYNAIGAESGRLASQEQSLQKQVDAQRAKVLDQLEHRDRIMAYQRQQASVEQVYRSALQKYDGLLMASNITSPNLAVLRQADLPSSPSRPRLLQNLVAGIVVGLLMGLCLALIQELRRRRVRCIDDVTQGMPGLLLGSIGQSQDKAGRNRS